MAARKPARFKAELKNLRELKVRFAQIAKAVDGRLKGTTLQYTGQIIRDAYKGVAILVRDKIRGNAQAAGVPRRLYSGARPAIFAFSDFDAAKDDKRQRSSMVGVRTGLSSRAPDPSLYIRWFPGSGKRHKDGSKLGSGGLSMSLGALYERGTKNRRVKPRRYFRSAIFTTRGIVIQTLTNAYKRAAARINSLK